MRESEVVPAELVTTQGPPLYVLGPKDAKKTVSGESLSYTEHTLAHLARPRITTT